MNYPWSSNGTSNLTRERTKVQKKKKSELLLGLVTIGRKNDRATAPKTQRREGKKTLA